MAVRVVQESPPHFRCSQGMGEPEAMWVCLVWCIKPHGGNFEIHTPGRLARTCAWSLLTARRDTGRVDRGLYVISPWPAREPFFFPGLARWPGPGPLAPPLGPLCALIASYFFSAARSTHGAVLRTGTVTSWRMVRAVCAWPAVPTERQRPAGGSSRPREGSEDSSALTRSRRLESSPGTASLSSRNLPPQPAASDRLRPQAPRAACQWTATVLCFGSVGRGGRAAAPPGSALAATGWWPSGARSLQNSELSKSCVFFCTGACDRLQLETPDVTFCRCFNEQPQEQSSVSPKARTLTMTPTQGTDMGGAQYTLTAERAAGESNWQLRKREHASCGHRPGAITKYVLGDLACSGWRTWHSGAGCVRACMRTCVRSSHRSRPLCDSSQGMPVEIRL
jgi:hypothetical protein